jgi:tetratricopeptide (TPR) repeat protein
MIPCLLLRAAIRLSPSLLLLLVASSCIPAHAQQHYDPFDSLGSTTSNVPGYENHGGTTLRVTVFAENTKTRLDRQCLIKLTNANTQNISWQTTDDRSEVGFGDLPSGHYELEVSAVGYLTAHREFQAVSSFIPVNLEIVINKDPAAVALTFADAAMPARARKETKHGVSALKSGRWDDANKRLAAAYKLAPENPDVNFLLGYLYYQKKELGRASQFLDTAANLSPGNVQTLSLLGRVSLEQQDYGRAVSNLEKAIIADSDYWVAHDLLAASYLKQQKFEQARQQAEIAISKGKEAATTSRLVLGQALINLGQRDQGIQTLKDFVASEPKNPSVPQVQSFIAQVEAEPAATGASPGNTSIPVQIAAVDPLVAAAEPTFSIRPWQPPSIDLNKPSVVANASCPADIVERTGKRVEEFVEDVSRIAAIEHLLHEQLDEMGDALTKETRTFNYVASFVESAQGSIAVDEYRQERLGLGDFPDHISSSGFATLALVFHPKMRDSFEMTCEGLGEFRGQPTWLVHFKQREDRPARMHDYRVGGVLYSLHLKGRAWITADRFQIVRIESELISPVPEIRLAGEHQVVEYGPVPFGKRNIQLWLPQSAEIYLDFRRHRYYRKHSFDHYMLFAVDAEEKHKAPTPQPTNNQPQPE